MAETLTVGKWRGINVAGVPDTGLDAYSVDPPGKAAFNAHSGELYIVGIAPGSTVLTVTEAGQTATLDIEVVAPPLALTLGPEIDPPF